MVEVMAKTSEAKMRANSTYEKKHIRQFLLKFHKSYDGAIIEKLDSVPSKNNYVRQLILKDLEKEKKEQQIAFLLCKRNKKLLN